MKTLNDVKIMEILAITYYNKNITFIINYECKLLQKDIEEKDKKKNNKLMKENLKKRVNCAQVYDKLC